MGFNSGFKGLIKIYNFKHRAKMKPKIPQKRNNKKYHATNFVINLPNRNSSLYIYQQHKLNEGLKLKAN